MPRVDDSLQRGIAFMYRTRGEAEKRVKLGGSAFVVGRAIGNSEHVRGGACAIPGAFEGDSHALLA